MVLHPRTVRGDRLAVVLPQPGEVVVLDARTGTADRIPVPDQSLHLTGWAKDDRTVVAEGTERSWLVDTVERTVDEARTPVGAGWVDLVTVDGVTDLRSFSAAGAYTGGRELRGPVIEVDGPTVSNTEAWASAHAYLGQTYAGAVGRSQGLLAVQGDLRPDAADPRGDPLARRPQGLLPPAGLRARRTSSSSSRGRSPGSRSARRCGSSRGTSSAVGSRTSARSGPSARTPAGSRAPTRSERLRPPRR